MINRFRFCFNFAFKFNLRRHTKAASTRLSVYLLELLTAMLAHAALRQAGGGRQNKHSADLAFQRAESVSASILAGAFNLEVDHSGASDLEWVCSQ
jgi:hypothetical protein